MKVTFFNGSTSTTTVLAPQVVAVGLVDAEKAELLSEINQQATGIIDAAAMAAAAAVAPGLAEGIRDQVKIDADRAAAAATSLGSVAALSPYMMATVRQMDGALPARPPAPFVFWQGWSDPGVNGANLMQPGDIWCREDTPTVPDPPLASDWSVYSLRDEPGIVLRRRPFPVLRPPLTGMDVSLDGGPAQTFTENEHRITGLTLGQTYAVVGFLRNYLGQGLPSEPKPVTVESGPFLDAFDRADQPLSQSPRWVDLRVGAGGRRLRVVNNRVTLQGTNELCAARAAVYLNPRQYAQCTVLNSSASTSEPRGVHLFLRTSEFVVPIQSISLPQGYSLNVTDSNWEIWEATTGAASRRLANGSHASVWPMTIRFEADGSTLRAFMNGVQVGMATDATHSRGFAGLGMNAASAEGATSVEIDNFECGNLV